MKRCTLPILLLVCCLLWGCGGKKSEAAPTPISVSEPNPTPAPTPAPTPEPTPEPEPTIEPTPTPTSAPVHILYNGAAVNSLTAKVNTGFTLSCDAPLSAAELRYVSDNEAVAKVDAAGLVSALSVGNATITVYAGESSASCKVTVFKPIAPTVSICFLNVPKTDVTMNASNNETLQFTALLTPADESARVIWSSTDPKVAEVSAEGLVTAISQGTCEVVCQAGEASARCWVRVKGQRINYQPAPADDPNGSPAIFITCAGFVNSDFTLNVGESVNMDYQLVNAEEGEVSWSIQNGAVASVDQNGVVYALKEGTTTLTVSCGSLSFTSTVRVKG